MTLNVNTTTSTSVTRTNTEKFVELTRVFKSDTSGQKITVAADQLATVRPSNSLGFPDHRSTITLKNGQEITLAQKYSEVRAMFGISA